MFYVQTILPARRLPPGTVTQKSTLEPQKTNPESGKKAELRNALQEKSNIPSSPSTPLPPFPTMPQPLHRSFCSGKGEGTVWRMCLGPGPGLVSSVPLATQMLEAEDNLFIARQLRKCFLTG